MAELNLVYYSLVVNLDPVFYLTGATDAAYGHAVFLKYANLNRLMALYFPFLFILMCGERVYTTLACTVVTIAATAFLQDNYDCLHWPVITTT
jgi:hypothetical protein